MSEEIDPALFERAAQEFFQGMKADIVKLPARARKNRPIDLEEQIELSRSRMTTLAEQIATGEFDRNVMGRARVLAAEIGVNPDSLGDDARLLLKTLTARAELEAVRFHVRYLHDPVGEYHEHDALFRGVVPALEKPRPAHGSASPAIGITLSELTELYLTKRKDRLAERTIVESRRVFDWLAQHFGGATPVAALDKARLREFRDALIRLSAVHQGRGGLPFASRQTEVESHRVSTKTASKYWSFAQSFFSWAEREGHIEQNPTTGLRVEIAVGDESRSPEPFSNDEVRLLLNTPLYRGHKGKNLNEPGHDLARGG